MPTALHFAPRSVSLGNSKGTWLLPKSNPKTEHQGRPFRTFAAAWKSGAGEQLLHEQTFSPAPKPIQEVAFTWIVWVIQFTMASCRQQCWQGWAWGGERLSTSRAGTSWVGVIVWKTHLSCTFWKRFQYVIYQVPLGSVTELCWTYIDLFENYM